MRLDGCCSTSSLLRNISKVGCVENGMHDLMVGIHLTCLHMRQSDICLINLLKLFLMKIELNILICVNLLFHCTSNNSKISQIGKSWLLRCHTIEIQLLLSLHSFISYNIISIRKFPMIIYILL
jgi:hypothetical protein